MKSAGECAPKKCQCGRKLEKPRYGLLYRWDRYSRWYMRCHCSRDYVWTWHPQANGCWKLVSDMPLFNTREIVAQGTEENP